MRGWYALNREENNQWYSNKELYEMMVVLSKGLEKTNAELAKTQTMIRDYNGLREKVNELEIKLGESQGKETGGKNLWGYIVGAIGIASLILSRINI